MTESGKRAVLLKPSAELADRLKAVARANRRSMSAEGLVALERHVKAEEAKCKRREAGDA